VVLGFISIRSILQVESSHFSGAVSNKIEYFSKLIFGHRKQLIPVESRWVFRRLLGLSQGALADFLNWR
jgi:hypothetical protein